MEKLTEFQYNCIDTLATVRNYQKLIEEDRGRGSFLFDQAILGPALTMQMRGIRVDRGKINIVEEETLDAAKDLQGQIEKIAGKDAFKWGKSIKPPPQQLAKLLYGRLKAPLQTNKDGSPTVNKEAIAKLIDNPKSSDEVIKIAELSQELGILEEDRKLLQRPLRETGRMHSSWNVAGTSTGRFSSKQDEYSFGANLQALSKRLHKIFIPDPGYVFVNIDQAQAESRGVAYLSGCKRYKEIHLEGNTHLRVCQMLWPDLIKTKIDAQNTYLPWNLTKTYYDLSKNVSHGCLSSNAEVLTKKGWVSCKDFSGIDEIVVWENGKLSWEIPVKWNVFNYCEKIINVNGRNLSFNVTPNHRLPVYNNGYVLGEKLAGDFKFSYGSCPISGNLSGEKSVNTLEARLLAATWADGYLRKDGWTIFGLKKERKIERLINLLLALGINYRIWTAGKNRLGCQIAIKQDLRKSLDWDMLLWDHDSRAVFLDELPYWDGHINKKSNCFRVFNVHKTELEIIATLCHITGKSSSIIKHGKPRENEQQCWLLYIKDDITSGYKKKDVSIEDYDGKVYCPTTSTGWFLIRNNGKISITGNSNYLLSPFGLSRQIHSTVKYAEDIQNKYFGEFPEIQDWQNEVGQQLKVYHYLVNPLGRTRFFLGRTWDKSLIKEAVAYIPQSLISQVNKIIMWKIWNYFDPDRAQLLLEGHDSNLFQVCEGDIETVEEILHMSRIQVPIRGDTMTTEVDAQWGYSWGKEDLQDWKGKF